jgi:hypothetical protein
MVVGIDKLEQQHFSFGANHLRIGHGPGHALFAIADKNDFAISHYGCLGFGLRIIGGINPRFCDYQACCISSRSRYHCKSKDQSCQKVFIKVIVPNLNKASCPTPHVTMPFAQAVSSLAE